MALYSLAYFELQPKYLCRAVGSAADVEWEECEAEDFCGKENEIEYWVDEDSKYNLDNWVDQYDMTCAPGYKFGLFGSLYFTAVVIGSLFLTPLADKFGRRPITLIGLALVSVCETLILFSTSINFTYLLCFFLGLSMPMRVFVGYILAMEFLPLQNTSIVTAVTLGSDGLGIFIASLWFLYISKDWKTFMLFSAVVCYATFAFIYFFFAESPKFLISRGRYDEARKVI